MAKERVSLKYAGPALEGGSMDLALVGPALVAFHGLLAEANTAINGNRAKLKVEIKGFKDGSFESVFEVSQSIASLAASMLLGPTVTSTLALLQCIGFVRGKDLSLIDVLRIFGGAAPAEIEDLPDGGARLGNANQPIIINGDVKNLIMNQHIGSLLAKAAAPLFAEGIESLEVAVPGHEAQQISREDAEIFRRQSAQEEVMATTSKRVIVGIGRIVLPLQKNSTVVLTLAGMKFKAKVADPNLLTSSKTDPFSLADHLEVELVTREIRSGAEIEYEYEITQVYQHIRQPQQADLPIQPA